MTSGAWTAATYRSWFLLEERLKNFRSIRSGLLIVVEESHRVAMARFGSGLKAIESIALRLA